MPLTLHTLKSSTGSRRTSKRLGRGNASGRGSYSTKGIKGQRARQGGRKGLIQLGVKHFVSRLPKVRGFISQSPKPQVVTIRDLKAFDEGAVVDRAGLVSKGLLRGSHRGSIKLIGQGQAKKLIVKLQDASTGARRALKAAGGSFEVVAPPELTNRR